MLTFKNIRIVILAGVLLVVGANSYFQKINSRSWNDPLEVLILPINGDAHAGTDSYVNSLDVKHFQEIDRWFAREAKRHDLDISLPVEVRLGPPVENHPPEFPSSANALSVLTWGLRFRWWAWRNTPKVASDLTQIRLFVMYHQGEENTPLQHSLGMEKGLLGLVHAFADKNQASQNNIVIAHEMLHTVGAIDKYVSWGAPVFPTGYAHPDRNPLFPQRNAEIMAGRIPTSHQTSYMAESLRSVLINEYTAAEINWLDQ